jgi:hemoglobin-like flavoprotein
MTALQIVLVQRTFRYLLPIGGTVAELFFRRLFELQPGLRAQLIETDPRDLREFGRELMQMLAVLVQALPDTARVEHLVADLVDARSAGPFTPGDSDAIGKALLDTIHVALGEVFTRDVYAAWGAAVADVTRRVGG